MPPLDMSTRHHMLFAVGRGAVARPEHLAGVRDMGNGGMLGLSVKEQPPDQVVVDEQLSSGLRYTETIGEPGRTFPVRRCSLYAVGVDEAVSQLKLLTYHQRFGTTALSVEGLAGVQSLPDHRGKGYMAILMQRALAGARERVATAFLFGIGEFYHRWRFVTCAPQTTINVRVAAAEAGSAEAPNLRAFRPADLPRMVALYNTANARRPWTVRRATDWDRLARAAAWQPASEVHVWEEDGELRGYVALEGYMRGWGPRKLTAEELVALDEDTAVRMLRFVADLATQNRREEFIVEEPLDSAVGRAARRIGCEATTNYVTGRGPMGAVLDRVRLLDSLEDELSERAASASVNAAMGRAAFAALRRGTLLPDDTQLLRLVMGDSAAHEVSISAHAAACAGWFPGGGTARLLLPHPHGLDEY
jgi:GNAT superfamily N-acetyltransferase